MDRFIVFLMLPVLWLLRLGLIGLALIVVAAGIAAYYSLPLGALLFGGLVGHILTRMLHYRCECEVCRLNYRTDIDHNPHIPGLHHDLDACPRRRGQ